MQTPSLENKIIGAGLELGFVAIGFANSQRLPNLSAFDTWLAENRHAEMGYMAKYREVRESIHAIEPWAKSAIVCLSQYRAPLDLLPGGLRIARYALGDDYHTVLHERLTNFVEKIQKWLPSQTRITVDTAPVFERSLAAQAGIGWIGKNAMLINETHGSFTFISQILIDHEFDSPQPVPDRCGTCDACIDVCPTNAIVAPHVVDARRCIAYWTIEHRGIIPRELRPLLADYFFGCDLCQDVCPWNRKIDPTDDPKFLVRDPYLQLRPVDILRMSLEQYTEWFRNAAIKRATYKGLLRNAAIVLGNTQTELNALIAQLSAQPDPIVRLHIAWAVGQFDSEISRTALKNHHDTDARVSEEIQWVLRG